MWERHLGAMLYRQSHSRREAAPTGQLFTVVYWANRTGDEH